MRKLTLRVDGDEVEFHNDVNMCVAWDDEPGFIEAKMTSEGIIVDHFDDEGTECLDTWAQTYEDFLEQRPSRFPNQTTREDDNTHAELNLDSVLFTWLEHVKVELRLNWGSIHELVGPFGEHGVSYGDDHMDGGGKFATIGFCLPDGVYAETECDTYGQLQGFRIYRDDSED